MRTKNPAALPCGKTADFSAFSNIAAQSVLLNLTAYFSPKGKKKYPAAKIILSIFLIQKAEKLKICDGLALPFKFKNRPVFSTFSRLVEKIEKVSTVSPSFPLHLVKRTFLFLKNLVFGLKTRRFKKIYGRERGTVQSSPPLFFQAATRYTNPGKPLTRRLRWSCRPGRMGTVYRAMSSNSLSISAFGLRINSRHSITAILKLTLYA